MEIIHYCTSIEGLKYIAPQSSESENYKTTGCKSEISSILSFISINSDFKFSIGKDLHSGLYFICERFKGSILTSLNGLKASVYELNQSFSDDNQTCWDDRFVITSPCEVVNEKPIADIHDYLTEKSRQGLLIICRYPEKINGIPEDDQDLVDLAILKFRIYGDRALTEIKLMHPQLVNRVIQGINKGLYKDYGI